MRELGYWISVSGALIFAVIIAQVVGMFLASGLVKLVTP